MDKNYLLVVLICISLNLESCASLCMLIGHIYIFVKYLLMSFAQFYIDFVFSLLFLLLCRRFLIYSL